MPEQHLIPISITNCIQDQNDVTNELHYFIAIASVSPFHKWISLRNCLYLIELHGFIDIVDSIRLICLLRSYNSSKRRQKVIQAEDKRLCN